MFATKASECLYFLEQLSCLIIFFYFSGSKRETQKAGERKEIKREHSKPRNRAHPHDGGSAQEHLAEFKLNREIPDGRGNRYEVFNRKVDQH